VYAFHFFKGFLGSSVRGKHFGHLLARIFTALSTVLHLLVNSAFSYSTSSTIGKNALAAACATIAVNVFRLNSSPCCFVSTSATRRLSMLSLFCVASNTGQSEQSIPQYPIIFSMEISDKDSERCLSDSKKTVRYLSEALFFRRKAVNVL
jgi:hypothetical protein